MREALMLQLEKFSYYQHLSLSGGQERPIFTCRIVDIRGTRFHVLSRIQDAGLDFTGRTNFIAHHLVFTPEEIRQFPTPPAILRNWPGWLRSWTKEPQLLENENWDDLIALAGRSNVPAQTWQRVSGDAVNGYGLLEARTGTSFRVDDQTEETILELFAECLEFLEVRDPRRDFRTAAWNFTFTTSMQEQDNPADFRWRCIHSDNPAAIRFASPDCRALSAVRATKCTGEETAFARTGRQAPRFVAQPQDARITEDRTARFTAHAEGVPTPTYQWFSVDRANSAQVLLDETNPELVVSNPVLGISRYVVSASNSAGSAQSNVATLSVEAKLKVAQVRIDAGSSGPTEPVLRYVKSEEDIDHQRKRLEAEKAESNFYKRQRRNKVLIIVLTLVLVAGAGAFLLKNFYDGKSSKNRQKSEGTKDVNKDPKATPKAPDTKPINNTSLTNSLPGTNQGGAKPVEKTTNSKSAHISTVPPPTIFDLPDGWTKVHIGEVQSSNAEFISPRFDLSTTAEGFQRAGDKVLFVCKTNFDKEFKVKIQPIADHSAMRINGIMIRESKNTNGVFLFIGASSTNIVAYSRNNEGLFHFEQDAKIVPSTPLYLRFTRGTVEHQFVPAYSFDADKWKELAPFIVSTKTQVLVGFALVSGNKANRVTVNFEDMSPVNGSVKLK